MTPRNPDRRKMISRYDGRSVQPGSRSGESSPLFSSVAFASWYVYSPRAAGWVAESSRVMCRRVKSSDPLWLPHYAGGASFGAPFGIENLRSSSVAVQCSFRFQEVHVPAMPLGARCSSQLRSGR